jgi:hypothetical protein
VPLETEDRLIQRRSKLATPNRTPIGQGSPDIVRSLMLLLERARKLAAAGAARLCRGGDRGRSLVTLEAEGRRGASRALAADVCPSSIR